MPAILKAIMLLSFLCLAHTQVSPLTGNNNADFATDVINIDMSAAYGNHNAPFTGPSYNITYPSGFVSPSTPMLILSIQKWEYYQSASDLYIYLYPNR